MKLAPRWEPGLPTMKTLSSRLIEILNQIDLLGSARYLLSDFAAWLGITSVKDLRDEDRAGDLKGTSADDLLVAGLRNQRIIGGGGDDILVGSDTRNVLRGGVGDDIMIGGGDNDLYVFSEGADVIDDRSGRKDRLRTTSALDQIRTTRDGADLLVMDDGLGASVRIVDHFGAGTVEGLMLGDGTLIDLTDGLPPPPPLPTVNEVYGTDSADLLVGSAGDDRLVGKGGDDRLDGGAGSDVLEGGLGNDSYAWGGGSAAIVDTGGTDAITTTAAFEDLRFEVRGDDLVITDRRDGSTMTVDGQYAGHTVETLVLGNGAGVSLTGGSFASPTGFAIRATDHGWGGVGANVYRGADVQTGPAAVDGNPNVAHVVKVALGTTVAQLEAMIADAAPGTTFQLEAGTYVFDDRLDIQRSDVTLKGAGEGLTVIAADVVGTDVIRVSAPWQKEAWGNLEGSEAKLATTLGAAAGEHATSVKLSSVAGLQAGDFLQISVRYTEYIDDGHDDYKGTLVEITGVDPVTGTVTLAHELGFDVGAGATVLGTTLLRNVVLGDFTIDFGEPENAVDPYRHINNNPQYVGTEEGMGGNGNRAIFLNSLTDSALYNVTIHNAGSNGVVVRTATDLTVNGLTVDGAQNLGEGGNGYGLEIGRTYFSDFENLTFKGNIRHAVVYDKDGSSGYNNVHVLSATANVDFHGGPDYKNIYYIEEMDLSQLKDDYTYGGIDYRDPNNVWENTVIFDEFTGAIATRISRVDPNYKPINYTGSDSASSINDYSAVRDNLIHLGSQGGAVNTGAGNDTIYFGSGDHVVATGAGRDVIHFGRGNGANSVLDFDINNDKLEIFGGSDANSAARLDGVGAIFAAAAPSGQDTVIDLGNGDVLTLVGVQWAALDAAGLVF
jgi:RTX calcium-binding nonapeptide repeat (4 copies)